MREGKKSRRLEAIRCVKTLQRFNGKVSVVGHSYEGCHLWTGAKNKGGYGVIKIKGRTELAHRVSYALHHGPVPSGLTVNHLCENAQCVAPGHLELATHKANAIDANRRRGRDYVAPQATCPHCLGCAVNSVGESNTWRCLNCGSDLEDDTIIEITDSGNEDAESSTLACCS